MDLRSFPYMPLHIARLQKSRAWLRCKRRPELAFFMINLWMRAWHEVPAGSIENDDEVLADAAICPDELWPSVKGELLRGWQVVGDRIHHPVVTEIATSSHESSQQNHRRTQKATEARKLKRAAHETPARRPVVPVLPHVISAYQADISDQLPDVTTVDDARDDDAAIFDEPTVTSDVTDNVTSDVTSDVTDNVTSTNRIEQIVRQKENLSSLRSDGHDDDDVRHDDVRHDDDAAKHTAPKTSTTAPATGMRLPVDWNPGEVGEEFARALGINPTTEFPKFRDYWLAKAGKEARKVDWPATWRYWCRNSNAGDRVRSGFVASSAAGMTRAPALSGSW
jgi:uncharacterized protein YdaU (DUF1376 family)